ncbi:MAG: Txe/YoeB family addiction module toxin [Bacteroidales bacterium]|nr:Txe/YoeB family addiction module toxin [Bacteroidales bacterium]
MEIAFSPEAQKDLKWWKENGDISSRKKIQKLLEEIAIHPTTGTGKPEQLTGNYSGCWSRRINKKDRLIYEIHEQFVLVLVLSMRGHYKR